MLTRSQGWALAIGFVVVGGLIAVGTFLARQRPVDDRPVVALVAPMAKAPAQVSAPNAVPAPAAATPAPPASERPHFDVVRVEPNGDTVLAGQGAPNSSVELLASGAVVAQATTDPNGHFVMLPPALKPGDHALSLRASGDAASESKQSVAVSVPEKGKGQVVVALAEPGQPTKLLSPPPVAVTPAPADVAKTPGASPAAKPVVSATPAPTIPAAGVVVRSVELENGNGFFASGNAVPGSKLQVYLNNSHVADVVAGSDSAWSVKIKKGLTGGHYVVRADASAGTKVTSRVEVPFDVPVAMAEPAAKAPAQSAPVSVAAVADATAGATPAAVVIEEISTASVRTGDNLWDISRVRLGEGRRYTRIYAANVAQIRDPNLIYPGQVFVMPTQSN